jgi:hypothetical protein
VKEGFAASLTEAATRFAISHSAVRTILVGMATRQQFEDALAAAQKGPLPSAALDRLSGLQHRSPRRSASRLALNRSRNVAMCSSVRREDDARKPFPRRERPKGPYGPPAPACGSSAPS